MAVEALLNLRDLTLPQVLPGTLVFAPELLLPFVASLLMEDT